MASPMATPRYCIQHSRFTTQDGWRQRDLSLSWNGNIAVTGRNVNTHRTYIDVYTNVTRFDSSDKPKIIYSKEFEKYEDERKYKARIVSFIDDNALVSCLGSKLEVFQVNKDEVLRSRRVNGDASCLSVRERREIFIGFWKSNKITVYDVIDLNEIKLIILQGIEDDCFPYDMTAIADRIFVSVGEAKEGSERKSLIVEEKNGRILSELTKPTDTVEWYVGSVGVNINTLGIAGAVWRDSYYSKNARHREIVFYSLLSENNCSFLIAEVESGVYRIRISDRGDMMITGDWETGEVKVYDMAEIFTYGHFKEKLAVTLQTDECAKLANFFKIPKDQTDDILSSDKPSENLLLTLEEKGILQPYNDDRLIEAFEELNTNPFCRNIADIFQKTRPSTYFKGVAKQLDEEMKKLRRTYEEERRQLKENIDALHEKLRKMSEAHQAMTMALVTNQFKTERDESQLQLSRLQIELQASKDSKTHTEKLLKQTEERLQKVIQDKAEIETEPKQWQMKHSFQSMTLEEKTSTDVADDSSMVAPADNCKYFSESSLGDEFGKLMVKVSVKLKNRNCIALATYFNLPETKIDLLHKETDMPGLTLLQILKERNVINMYDVLQLQEALALLELVEVNETLVIPYQNQIDPIIQQKHKITRKEH